MDYTAIIKPPTSRQLKAGKVTLKPGESVGEHITEKREELIIVLCGEATITVEGEEKIIKEAGETHYIAAEKKHDITNNDEKTLTYVYAVSLFD